MTESGGESFHITPEYFRDPTTDTYEAFDKAVTRIWHEFADHAAILRHDYITGSAGDLTGPRVDFRASIRERHRPAVPDETSIKAELSVYITAGPASPRMRKFSDGETVGTMTDDEYNAALSRLWAVVPSDDWAWIDRARLLASTGYDADFAPFAVNELLDMPPSISPVCRSYISSLGPVRCNNGMQLHATRLEANEAYTQGLSDDDITREVTIAMPAGERYSYFVFTDNTKQMFVETRDEATRAALAAQGYAVIDRSANVLGSVEVTPGQRRLGIHAPNDILMKRFRFLIDEALDAGVAPD